MFSMHVLHMRTTSCVDNCSMQRVCDNAYIVSHTWQRACASNVWNSRALRCAIDNATTRDNFIVLCCNDVVAICKLRDAFVLCVIAYARMCVFVHTQWHTHRRYVMCVSCVAYSIVCYLCDAMNVSHNAMNVSSRSPRSCDCKNALHSFARVLSLRNA